MNKKQIRFIVNPFSGKSNKQNFAQLVQENLDLEKFAYDYFLTEAPRHAITLAKEAVEKQYHMVVAVGGDGTVNEVAEALKDTNTILGIIPGGSGNGFAMHIGMGRNQTNAIKILNFGEPKLIDSCHMNKEFFINLAGVGFDARIAYKIKQSAKRGFLLYLKTVLIEAFKFSPLSYEIETDSENIKGEYAVIAVANATMYGYNFTIAPGAELTDGKFDVILIRKASILRYLLSSWRMLNNSLHKSRLVRMIKSEQVHISTSIEDFYHLDGEGYKSPAELHFEMSAKSIQVLFPKGAKPQ